MTYSKIASILLATSFLFLLSACDNGSKKGKYQNSEFYDFASPKVVNLPELLDEISGLAYYPKDTSIFGIIDEDGLLFKVSLNNPRSARHWQFDKKRDYEELLLVDSTFYVLVSNGDIVKINFKGDSILTTKSDFSEESKLVNEFESMYLDHDSARLIIVCKTCDIDPKSVVSSFAYSLSTTDSAAVADTTHKAYTPFKKLDMSFIEQKLNVDEHLKASAAAVHPLTGDIYLISSIRKVIVILNKQGEYKEHFELDPAIYKQPEGIAFTPEGNMIISNEFADVGFANLLLLKNKKTVTR